MYQYFSEIMQAPSFTLILSGIFAAYIAHTSWTFYGIFYPERCYDSPLCIKSFLSKQTDLEVKEISHDYLFLNCGEYFVYF